MRIGELVAHLGRYDDNFEVFVKVVLDFLDEHPELVCGHKVIDDGDRALLDVSVRLGDLAFHEGPEKTTEMPCGGCPLDKAESWLFEHFDIDSLLDGFCDRPDNWQRCCFLPEPPAFGECQSSVVYSTEVDDLPF